MTKKRSYDSSRRKQQARQTRHQITQSARELFIEKGYGGATIQAIADGAGVSVETIYAKFGNKRAILSHLIEVSVKGDDEPLTLLDRPEIKAVEQEMDQLHQIHMFAGQMRVIMNRMAPLFDVLRTAAKSEPDIKEMREHILSTRRHGMRHFVQALVAHGPLQSGLSIEQATDQVFALTSGEMFTVLRVDLGWSDEAYEVWLEQTLIALLLPQ